jgi:hypothetical protein
MGLTEFLRVHDEARRRRLSASTEALRLKLDRLDVSDDSWTFRGDVVRLALRWCDDESDVGAVLGRIRAAENESGWDDYLSSAVSKAWGWLHGQLS